MSCPHFLTHSTSPLNAEPASSRLLTQTYLTPQSLVFSRNHGDIPSIQEGEAEAWTVDVVVEEGILGEAEGERRWSGTVGELRRMGEEGEVTAVLQCAGNRRAEMSDIRPTEGIQWERNTIANVRWQGLRLSTFLQHIGIPPDLKGRHVHFAADQKCEEDSYYGASVPMEDILEGDAILAWGANGQPLTVEHGWPLRVIVPGHIGARSVKWLRHIRISRDETPSFYQQSDYKVLPPHVTSASQKPAALASTPALQHAPLNSAICDPSPGSTIWAGQALKVSGWAVGSRGRRVTGVHVRAGAGGAWVSARLRREEDAKWGWTLWEAEVRVQGKVGEEVKIAAWAEEEGGGRQPEKAQWNLRGVANDGWSVVKVKLC